jgi:hypothetical protein
MMRRVAHCRRCSAGDYQREEGVHRGFEKKVEGTVAEIKFLRRKG